MNDIFVARQPIFDVRQNVVGYELLYRADGSSDAASGTSTRKMSASVIVDGVLGVAWTFSLKARPRSSTCPSK